MSGDETVVCMYAAVVIEMMLLFSGITVLLERSQSDDPLDASCVSNVVLNIQPTHCISRTISKAFLTP